MKQIVTSTILALALVSELSELIHAQENSIPNSTNRPPQTIQQDSAVTAPTPLEREAPRVYRREIVSFGQDVTLRRNEVCSDMVVIGGNATVAGTVEGNLVVIFGSADISGKVERDMVVVLGAAHIASGGTVEDDAVVVGGKIDLGSGGTINGARREFVLGNKLLNVKWIGDWFHNGFLLARPFPPSVHWVWIVVSMLLVFYFLLAALFPRPLQACVVALETTTAGSFFAGALALVLIGPLMFLLAISVAGILVIPILLFSILAALVFGKVAIYRSTGEQLARQFNLAGLQQPAVALLIGFVLFYLLYTVPLLGFLVWGVATVWGLGAVLVAAFTRFRREQEPPLVTTTSAALTGISSATFQEPPPTIPVSADLVTLRRAGFWIRFGATLLDLVLLGTLTAFVGPLFLFFWAAYHVAMWTWKGTTIGGIVVGIKIIRVDGQPINFAVALVRSLSSFFSAVVLFLGFFWAGWDKDKQAWHDKIAGTIVVKLPKGLSLILL